MADAVVPEVKWKSGSSSAPLPPMLDGLPVLGSALSLGGDVRTFLHRAYRDHGPIFRIKVPGRVFTVMAGPEANVFMSREAGDHLRSWEVWEEFNSEMGTPRALTNVDGEIHSRMRKVMKPGYSRSAVADRLDQVVTITRSVVKSWKTGEPRNVNLAFKPIVTEQLGRMLGGQSPAPYLDDLILFLRINLTVSLIRSAPGFLKWLPRYKRARARVIELGHKVVAAHRAEPTREGTLLHDVFAAMQEDPALFAEHELPLVALGPFIAGVDTAANACTFLMYALLTQPELMQACTDEADAMFKDGVVEPDKLKTLKYAAMEALRLYPIAPLTQRIAARPFEFGGHRVDENTTLLMATSVSHYLDRFWKDPGTFDITRYQPPRNEHRQPGAYAPFGQGPHICLGAGLAETQIVLTVATMLHTARFALHPPGYTLKVVMSPTLVPDRHFQMIVTGHRNP